MACYECTCVKFNGARIDFSELWREIDMMCGKYDHHYCGSPSYSSVWESITQSANFDRTGQMEMIIQLKINLANSDANFLCKIHGR